MDLNLKEYTYRRKRAEGIKQVTSYGNQTFIVWSTLAVATTLTNFPASDALGPAPFDLASASPVAEFAVVLPHARVVMKCPCASRTFMHRPVESSQTRIVLSSPADNKNLPEGWKTSA